MRKIFILLMTALISGAAVSQASGGVIPNNQVLIIGDSYFDVGRSINITLSQHAVADGILAAGQFHQVAVSGTWLGPGGSSPRIPEQYANNKQGVKWVIMDGGGNDCLQHTCPLPFAPSCQTFQDAVKALKDLYSQMATNGVKKVIFLSYHHFQGFPNLENQYLVLGPMLKEVVDKTTKPIVYWFDVVPLFLGKERQYTLDGVHPNDAGGKIIADALWQFIKDKKFFDTASVQITSTVENATVLRPMVTVFHNRIQVSLSLSNKANICARLYALSGRKVAIAERQAPVSGFQTIQFPLNAAAPGVYCLEIDGGGMFDRSKVLVR
ncbi:MAG: SGNH/GDSL hydrolase family protein [Chitinispirillaceae bacterium]|nr:SGNH/GDSL hydrolase family protein [Chitinispirillaceae bacterium]